jgi:tRNA U54 and U55 pseudouridine synthase Pus10
MFIGEDLNEKQIAALQAVADASLGARFASVESIKNAAEDSPRRFRCLYDENDNVPDADLAKLLSELEKEYLIQRSEKKDKVYYGLTDDGKRCNLITVPFI